MLRATKILLCASSLVGLASAPAEAAMLVPVSYAMRNGQSGTFKYWDRAYSPANPATAPITDGAPLSGGLGDLTDGIVAAGSWNFVENAQGTGPYVGWGSIQPQIVFDFGALYVFSSMTLYFDDPINNFGTVDQPSRVDVSYDGGPSVSVPIPNQGSTGPASFTVPINTMAKIIGITLFDSINTPRTPWIMLSEVGFEGNPDPIVVPEPSSVAIWSIAGVGLCLFARRRRNSKSGN